MKKILGSETVSNMIKKKVIFDELIFLNEYIILKRFLLMNKN